MILFIYCHMAINFTTVLFRFDRTNLINCIQMSDNERIMTLHPQGKTGVNILKRRYDTIKEFILKTIKEHGELTYQNLDKLAVQKLKKTFDGKISWYVVSVKLDLEARNLIERIPNTSPHKLRLAS